MDITDESKTLSQLNYFNKTALNFESLRNEYRVNKSKTQLFI